MCGVYSEDVRQRLLRVDDLSLEKVCRADAESKKSSQYIAETNAEVYGLKQKSGNHYNHPVRSIRKSSEEPAQRRRACGSCGLVHPRKQCPAYGKQYLRCKKSNHFAKYCRNVPHRTDAIEQYLLGSQNIIALEVDLFATRLSTQCQCFFSWQPDPYAEATDTSLQNWTHLRGYANPPWSLIGKTISQVQSQQARIALVAPVWRTQPWYPILLITLIDYPRIISPAAEITTSQPPPPMVPQLAA